MNEVAASPDAQTNAPAGLIWQGPLEVERVKLDPEDATVYPAKVSAFDL